MKCQMCKQGETEKGYASVMLERNDATVIFKHVPADICNNCGEEFVNETISTELFSIASNALQAGVMLDVREYLAA